MQLLKTYQFNIAWYALVELDDKSRVELKLRQEKKPVEDVILRLADDFQKAVAATKLAEEAAEQARQEQARRIIDKETGTEISKLTVGALSKLLSDRIKAQPTISGVLVADTLKVGE